MKTSFQIDTFGSADSRHGSLSSSSAKHTILTLRVFFLDNHYRTFEYTPTMTTRELVSIITKSIALVPSDSFVIFSEVIQGGRTIERPLSGDDYILSQINSKNESRLLFKARLFKESQILRADPYSNHLFYVQAKERIISGDHPCPFQLAVRLAGIQLYIENGGHYVANKCQGALLTNMAHFFSKQVRDEVPKSVLQAHFLRSYESVVPVTYMQMSWHYLKRVYIIEALKLPTFGCTYFYCKQKKIMNLPRELVVGVKNSGLVLLNKQKELLREWNFAMLERWGSAQNVFYVQTRPVDDHSGFLFEFSTDEAESMAAMLKDYSRSCLDDYQEEFRDAGVAKVQAVWRGYTLRKKLKSVRMVMAVDLISLAWKRYRNN